MSVDHHYELTLFLDTDVNETLWNLYIESATKRNVYYNNCTIAEKDKFYDAGFDLFSPIDELIPAHARGIMVNQRVKTSMTLMDINNEKLANVSYYLYSRSSTATKTPLRLANAVGIIDAGYRGDITAVFDNNTTEPYTISAYQRLLQICPPNLSLPMIVHVKRNLPIVETSNARGANGFGSTG
jgi:dUTP pyrophosphatase